MFSLFHDYLYLVFVIKLRLSARYTIIILFLKHGINQQSVLKKYNPMCSFLDTNCSDVIIIIITISVIAATAVVIIITTRYFVHYELTL